MKYDQLMSIYVIECGQCAEMLSVNVRFLNLTKMLHSLRQMDL
jgi:hypothetical protein